MCTCPSRALIHEDIYDAFMERALKRVAAIKMGDPLDPTTMLGAQNSTLQLQRILAHIESAKTEGAQALCGGGQAQLPGDQSGGYYVQPTIFKGHNKMRIFQARRRSGFVTTVRNCRQIMRRLCDNHSKLIFFQHAFLG